MTVNKGITLYILSTISIFLYIFFFFSFLLAWDKMIYMNVEDQQICPEVREKKS